MRKAEKHNTIGAIFTLMVICSGVLFYFKDNLGLKTIWVTSPIWVYASILLVAFLGSFIYNSYKYRNSHGRDY